MSQRASIAFERAAQAYRQFVNPLWTDLLSDIGILREFVGGEGAYLLDASGNRFLDLIGGFGAAALGHGHSGLKKVLIDAVASSCPGITPWGISPQTGELACKLCELSGSIFQKVHFASGGAEAIDAALKFAAAATGRDRFLVFEGGFHGLTAAATGLSAGQWSEPFPRIWPNIERVPPAHPEILAAAIEAHRPAAVVLEVIQGSGGMRPWGSEALKQLGAIAKNRGVLVIVDEVMTGLGRTGEWFSFAAEGRSGFYPDFVVVSKVLTGGIVPLSAVLMTDEIFHAVFTGRHRVKIHGSTFSGARLGMLCGLGVLDIIARDDLLAHVRRVGARIEKGISLLQSRCLLAGFFGRGLLVGIDIGGDNPEARAASASATCLGLMDRGILTTVGSHDPGLLRLTPPFVLKDDDVDQFLDALEDTLQDLRLHK
jgi:ornithine--oxo-acid transaminase